MSEDLEVRFRRIFGPQNLRFRALHWPTHWQDRGGILNVSVFDTFPLRVKIQLTTAFNLTHFQTNFPIITLS